MKKKTFIESLILGDKKGIKATSVYENVVKLKTK